MPALTPGGAGARWWPTTGRATCASCATPSSGRCWSARDGRIEAEHLLLEPTPPGASVAGGAAPAAAQPPAGPRRRASPRAGADAGAAEAEKRRIEEALAACGGNQSRAAKLLGIARSTLVLRLEAYGITRPRKRK